LRKKQTALTAKLMLYYLYPKIFFCIEDYIKICTKSSRERKYQQNSQEFKGFILFKLNLCNYYNLKN